MKLVEQSPIFPAHGGMAALSVVLRIEAAKYVVHYRNHDTGGYYQGMYTQNERKARREYAKRLDTLLKSIGK